MIELGGSNGSASGGARRVPPTLVLDVSDAMAVMQQEIFGPILPIETYTTLDQAIERINARPRPLAMYMFGGRATERRRVLEQTIAGGVTLDDTLWHFSNENLPFGGVGASGYGAYHGERGFLTFSHRKPVFAQSLRRRVLLYPALRRPFRGDAAAASSGLWVAGAHRIRQRIQRLPRAARTRSTISPANPR